MSTKLHYHYSHGQTILNAVNTVIRKWYGHVTLTIGRLTWTGFDGLAVSCPKGLGSELHLDPLFTHQLLTRKYANVLYLLAC